jgi:hypothetical protein
VLGVATFSDVPAPVESTHPDLASDRWHLWLQRQYGYLGLSVWFLNELEPFRFHFVQIKQLEHQSCHIFHSEVFVTFVVMDFPSQESNCVWMTFLFADPISSLSMGETLLRTLFSTLTSIEAVCQMSLPIPKCQAFTLCCLCCLFDPCLGRFCL